MVTLAYDDGQFSPDGKRVVYASDVSGRLEVYLRPFEGGGLARQVSTGGGELPQWTRDGSGIVYRSGERTLMRADVSAAGAVAEPRELFTLPEPLHAFAPLRDGRFLVAVRDATAGQPARIILRWPEQAARR